MMFYTPRHCTRRRTGTKLTALLLTAAAVVFTVAAVQPAPSVGVIPAAVTTVQNHPYGPYHNARFHTRNVCVEDHIMSASWPSGDVANAYEPALNTGWRSASQTCNDFPLYQVIKVYLYSAQDGRCGKVGWGDSVDPSPDNHTYSYTWDYYTIWINTWYYAGCRDTQHARVRSLSRAFGHAFGLGSHNSCWGTYSVMDECSTGAWPGGHDRNGAGTKFQVG